MKKRSFRIYLILTLFWTAGIFLHSAMPAAASNAESGGVLAVVQMILPWITHGVLRKAAHFLEFAVLGILLTGTFHGARNFTLAKPMLFAVLRRAHPVLHAGAQLRAERRVARCRRGADGRRSAVAHFQAAQKIRPFSAFWLVFSRISDIMDRYGN